MTTLKPLALAAALALSALGAPGAHAAGGTLTVAPFAPGDPGSFDPIDTFLVAWGNVGSQLYDGLTMRGADMKLVPGLATHWEMLDKDTRIRFTLRKDVKFHDGEPFNAQAVKFTFDRLLGDEGKKGPQQSNYNAIKEVKVVDDLTVDFILSQPDPVLLTKLAGYGAMIVPPRYIQEKGDAYFNTHPVGTGPFRFVSYEPKISLTLERNPDYWGGAPKLDKVVYRYITEPSTQASELLAGRLDIAANIPLSMTSVIKENKNLKIVDIDGPTTVALRYNTRDGITANKEVRKALIMAVDRDAIIKQILLGYAVPTASFQGKLSFGYDPTLKVVPFDLAKAREILKQQGVKPGTPVQIDYRGSDQNFREVAQAVAGYLQAAGLKPTLKGYETNVLLNDIIPNGKTGNMWQNTWGGWTFDYDNTAYAMYHSGQKWNPYDKDPKLDAMLEAQRGTYDREKRLKTLQDIARYVQDQALEMPLYSLKAVFGVNDRVKDLTIPSDGRFRFIDASVQ
ncbi:ABC transporter substrate-binding protein [uncultured Castellaniella sp.]|uniref:ABC transporter substrate-binding protein n=1 Tax=uncultured Castellaniella sp. TaxID=647907 RepID=UPI00261DAA2B|nr:ABC transporter substrate-binding protein [uncultured Castellaniella sp.]